MGKRNAIRFTIPAVVLAAATSPVVAAPLYWDRAAAATDTTNATGGATSPVNVWGGANADSFWSDDDAEGGALFAYNTNSEVYFSAGTSATPAANVTLGGAVAANSLNLQEGTTTLTAGTATNLSVGSGGITVDSAGVLIVSGSARIVTTAPQDWNNASSTVATITNANFNSLTTIKSGSFRFGNNNGSFTNTGGLVIDGGTVEWNTVSGGIGGQISLKSGSLLARDKFKGLNNSTLSLDGNFSVGTNNGSAGDAGSAATLKINGNYTLTTDTTFQLKSVIDGAGTVLSKAGASSLVLTTTTNTYSGGTVLKGGTLQILGDGSLGASGGDLTFEESATLQLNGATTLNAGRSISIASGKTATINTNSFDTVVDGATTGSGTLVKSGAGDLLLATTNGHTGGTTLNGGSVSLVTNTSLGSGPLTFTGSARIASSNTTGRTIGNPIGTFAGSSAVYSFGSTTNTGTLNFTNVTPASLLVSGTATRTFAIDSDTTFANNFTGSSGASLVKTGTATVTFNGNNTYGGATTVRAGVLIANGTIGAVNVGDTNSLNTAATFGGSGSAGNVAVVTPAGIINPALVGTVDDLSVVALTMTANGTLAFDGIGATIDRINASGAVGLGASNLAISLTNPSTSAIYFLINKTSAGAISGGFATLNGAALSNGESLAEGGQFSLGGQAYKITYLANFGTGSFEGGNDVAITAVPEPTALAALSLLAAGLLRRRRVR